MMAPTSADTDTVKLGLLMETAQSQQQQAEASLRRLGAQVQGLDAVVREEIRRTLVGELGEVLHESQQAVVVLQRLRRAARLQVLLWSALAALGSGIGGLLAAWVVAPSAPELRALRSERDQLASVVSQLQQQGGRAELRRCGTPARLCVQVDRHAGAFGPNADYFVIRGY